MNMLVIGLGEVGSAIKTILERKYQVAVVAKEGDTVQGTFGTLHICFPWSETFPAHVEQYQKRYGVPQTLTIIHSTVPIGTSAARGAVHSPVRGTHPDMVPGIETFVKYFGGPRAEEAANIFSALGIKTKTTPKSENTEALKLWDTTYYAWNIVFGKNLKRWCDERGLDFDLIYSDANQTYNAGYTELGKPQVVRPTLRHVPGKIGGHCLIPNAELLDDDLAKFIIEQNLKY